MTKMPPELHDFMAEFYKIFKDEFILTIFLKKKSHAF